MKWLKKKFPSDRIIRPLRGPDNPAPSEFQQVHSTTTVLKHRSVPMCANLLFPIRRNDTGASIPCDFGGENIKHNTKRKTPRV